MHYKLSPLFWLFALLLVGSVFSSTVGATTLTPTVLTLKAASPTLVTNPFPVTVTLKTSSGTPLCGTSITVVLSIPQIKLTSPPYHPPCGTGAFTVNILIGAYNQAGNYTLTAKFAGNSVYAASTASAQVVVTGYVMAVQAMLLVPRTVPVTLTVSQGTTVVASQTLGFTAKSYYQQWVITIRNPGTYTVTVSAPGSVTKTFTASTPFTPIYPGAPWYQFPMVYL
jgi:hypothetical protein